MDKMTLIAFWFFGFILYITFFFELQAMALGF